ncbi:MAG: cytidylate kinase-like family protein [Oscillospiraceae bacterium]|nr:cytidylate kinase-like family protein [Oscillospiraceae bacterium]
MSYKVITIGRQFGSGGHNIGEKLAEKLGFSYYDKNLIELAAEKSGMSHGVLSEADEKAANPWLYAALSQTGQTHINMNICTNDALFSTQSEIIRNIAKTENAVIVGRCSDYILKDEDVDLINIYVYAPMEARIKRTMERDKVNEAQAVSLIKRNDKQRKLYYDFYTDRKWASHVNYDITINSETFGIDGSVDIIYQAVINR